MTKIAKFWGLAFAVATGTLDATATTWPAVSGERHVELAHVTRRAECYVDGPAQGRPADLILAPGETVSLLPDAVGDYRRIATDAGVKCWTSQDAVDRH